MPVSIFHIRSGDDLEPTAERVFGALSVLEFDDHDSSHYPENTYYLGELGDLKVRVSIEDDLGYEDFQYWVVLDLPPEHPVPIDEAGDAMVLELLRGGFEVARTVGSGADSLERAIYALDPAGELTSRIETRPLPPEGPGPG